MPPALSLRLAGRITQDLFILTHKCRKSTCRAGLMFLVCWGYSHFHADLTDTFTLNTFASQLFNLFNERYYLLCILNHLEFHAAELEDDFVKFSIVYSDQSTACT